MANPIAMVPSFEGFFRIAGQVPTDKARAFAFDIDWDAVHAPWHNPPFTASR